MLEREEVNWNKIEIQVIWNVMPSKWMIYVITYQKSQTFGNTGVRTSCLT
jgi:hypothetical protein